MNRYQKKMSKAAKRNYKMFGVIESYDIFYRKFKRENKQYENFKKHRKKFSEAFMKGVMQGLGNANILSMIRYARKYLRPHEYIEFIKKCLHEDVSPGRVILDILQVRK